MGSNPTLSAKIEVIMNTREWNKMTDKLRQENVSLLRRFGEAYYDYLEFGQSIDPNCKYTQKMIDLRNRILNSMEVS